MRTEKYDVLILGGGNAGMGVTVATRAAGLSVAMVESRDLGGTCPGAFSGCDFMDSTELEVFGAPTA